MKPDLALFNWGDCEVPSIRSSINPSLAVKNLPCLSIADFYQRRTGAVGWRRWRYWPTMTMVSVVVWALVPIAFPQSVIKNILSFPQWSAALTMLCVCHCFTVLPFKTAYLLGSCMQILGFESALTILLKLFIFLMCWESEILDALPKFYEINCHFFFPR